MPSPADVQAQAIADVERIAQALYVEIAEALYIKLLPRASWEHVPEEFREGYRAVVRNLLRHDTVRVGRRPETGPEPMANQLEISPIVSGGGRYRQQTAKEGR